MRAQKNPLSLGKRACKENVRYQGLARPIPDNNHLVHALCKSADILSVLAELVCM